MLGIVDAKELGYGAVSLAGMGVPSSGSGSGPGSSCGSCAAYRTEPELSGTLRVDPEIRLPSPGMDVEVAYYYASDSAYNGPFGYARTINLNLTAQASGLPVVVTFMRGDGSLVTYEDNGSGQFEAGTPGLLNTLVADVGQGLWKETTPNGTVTAYPLDTTGQITSVSYAQDAVGNRHTFSYDSGLLSTLEDAVGRLVTFSYGSNSLLESIEDWAGRRTTFQYDTASVPGKPLLTTVIGPSGCQTGYGYDGNGFLTGITDPNGYATTYAYDDQLRVTQRTVATAGTWLYEYLEDRTVVTDPDRVVVSYVYDVNYGATQVEAGGSVVNFTRNARNQETMRQNALGAITTTVYDATGMPIASVDPLGHATTMLRDAYNNVTTTIFADGSTVEQVWGYAGSAFDATGEKRRLQSVVDPLGHRTSFAYNPRGQMVEVTDVLGAVTTYSYDGFGNMVEVTDALGSVTTSIYDLAGNVTGTIDPFGHQTTTTYDPQNRPIEVTNELSAVTTLAYDGVGNLIVEIDPLGHRTSISYNVWDSPVEVTDALGQVSTTIHDVSGRQVATQDALGNFTTTVYDDQGRIQAFVTPLGYRTTTVYDAAGRVTATIDPLGYVSTTVYDLADRAVATVDALGRISTTVYDAVGQPVATVDALGQASTTVYDLAGRVVSNVDALDYRSTTVYDAAGRSVAIVDALGQRTSYHYDALGRLVEEQNERGFTTTTLYDARGQVKAEVTALGYRTTYGYDAAGRQVTEQNALRYVTTTVYDAAGRMVASVDPLGYRTTRIYDAVGQVLATANPLGHRTSYGYDTVGNQRWETNALDFVTTLAYDAEGRQVAVENALGGITTSMYDARGQETATIDPLGYRTTYGYDPVGNMMIRVDGRGIATSYTLDVLDRVTRVLHPDGGGVTLSYDVLGQQTLMVDRIGTTSYSYDALGQQTGVVYPLGDRLTYAYDATGNRTVLVDPDGGRTSYTYDGQDRLRSIRSPQNELTNITLNAIDQVTVQNLPGNVLVGTRYYTNNGQERQRSIGPRSFVSNYDRAGRRVSLHETDNNVVVGVTTYTYDAADQLVNEVRTGPAYNVTYSYDGAGNRLTRNDSGALTTWEYDIANQLKLQTIGTSVVTLSYDGNGNTVLLESSSSVTTQSYDEENRLVRQVSPGADIGHDYFGDGRRARYQPNAASASWVRFVWDEDNVLQETTQAGATVAQYVDYPGEWGNLISMRRAGATSYYGFDHQANARLLMDPTGAVVSTYNYKGFGEEVGHTGTIVNPFRFGGEVGYYRDRGAQLYVRNRHYYVPIARWYQRDPLGFDGGGWNLYRYVGNNPVNWVDPSGEIPVQLAACIPFLACATALGAVCSDCGTNTRCWGDCLVGTIQHLPSWAKWACGGAATACLCAVSKGRLPKGAKSGVKSGVKQIKKLTKRKPKCPKATKDMLQKRVKIFCTGTPKCTGYGSMPCNTLIRNYHRNSACYKARVAIALTCYNGGDRGHREQIHNRRAAMVNCMSEIRYNCPKHVSHGFFQNINL